MLRFEGFSAISPVYEDMDLGCQHNRWKSTIPLNSRNPCSPRHQFGFFFEILDPSGSWDATIIFVVFVSDTCRRLVRRVCQIASANLIHVLMSGPWSFREYDHVTAQLPSRHIVAYGRLLEGCVCVGSQRLSVGHIQISP